MLLNIVKTGVKMAASLGTTIMVTDYAKKCAMGRKTYERIALVVGSVTFTGILNEVTDAYLDRQFEKLDAKIKKYDAEIEAIKKQIEEKKANEEEKENG